MTDPNNAWTSATPLSNADFKALLATPRPDWQRGGGAAATPRATPGGGGKKEQKPFKAPKPRPKPQQQQDDDDGPKYRDRAKERRDGSNADYEDAEAELAARGIRPEALGGLSIADTKFLGGDMAHTHLVKGLDYALLQQERIKQQKQQQHDPAAAAAPGRAKEQPATFVTPQGRALHAALFSQPTARQRAAAVREMFLPRRLAFVYDFEGTEDGGGGAGSELPTTLRRSQADCPPPPDLLPASADGVLLGRVARVCAYISAHLMGKGGQRKPKKKEHADAIKSLLAGSTPEAAAAAAADGGAAEASAAAAAAAAAQEQQQQQQRRAPVDDDEDIFGDAGTDYVPEVPVKQGGAAAAAARGGGYFDSRDDMSDLPPPPPPGGGADVDMEIEEGELPGPPPPPPAAPGPMLPPPPRAGGGGIGAAAQQQWGGGGAAAGAGAGAAGAAEEKWRPRKQEVSEQTRILLKQMGDDAYGEFFPEMGGAALADEEEEEGGKKKGAAGAAGAEGGKEGAEKGARRPGAMTDDRRREQKLDGQLGKIKQLFEEKGFGNQAAFKKPDRLEVGATPARKRPRI